MAHFPAAGEMVIFDRSWYNRAGVEFVMGFCTKEEHERFLEVCPKVERFIVDNGIQLIKFWLEVSDEDQKRRFEARINDPLRQWKLSTMDLPSRSRWYDYSRARDLMLEATDTKHAPWYIVRSDDKRLARLNCIAHLLSLIPYQELPRPKVSLPERSEQGAYDDQLVRAAGLELNTAQSGFLKRTFDSGAQLESSDLGTARATLPCFDRRSGEDLWRRAMAKAARSPSAWLPSRLPSRAHGAVTPPRRA